MKFFVLAAVLLATYVAARPADEDATDYAKAASYNGPSYDKPAATGYNGPSYDKPAPTGYFQYANVPGPDEYEFGYNRGNAHHSKSHYEQSKDHKFRTRVKWNEANNGYGEHYFEYNHGDYSAPAYSAPAYAAPAYSAPAYEAPKY